jgi:UDP-2-acetamido-2-deoxy-ribo-hexuluronate aminotransferase
MLINNMMVPLLDLSKQHNLIKDEMVYALEALLVKGDFIQGAEVRLFEKELSDLLEIPHVITCGNGTDALQIALMAFGFKRGDEVIVPAFTYIATLEVIELLGLKPVLVDVDPDNFFISLEGVKDAITPKTVAIIPVHLYGQCGDMESLMQLANFYDIKIIEDNAQSLGSTYTFSTGQKKFLGNLGHIGTTSFFPSKNLGALGDGGAILTSDPELAAKIRMIANHGQKEKYQHQVVGVNSRLDTLQAAFLRIKLRYFSDSLAGRKRVAERYNLCLYGLSGLNIPFQNPDSDHTYNQYTIRISGGQRDYLKENLRLNGISTMVYYPIPLHLQAGYRHLNYQIGDFPVAEQLASDVLSLPIDPFLSEDAQDRILSILSKR